MCTTKAADSGKCLLLSIPDKLCHAQHTQHVQPAPSATEHALPLGTHCFLLGKRGT